MADFNKLHGEQLIAFPSVRQIRSFFVMKEVTDNAKLEFWRRILEFNITQTG